MAGEGGVWSLLGGEGRGHIQLKYLAVSGVQSWHPVTPSLWAPGASPWPSQNPVFSSVAQGYPLSPPPAKGGSKQDHTYVGESALQE